MKRSILLICIFLIFANILTVDCFSQASMSYESLQRKDFNTIHQHRIDSARYAIESGNKQMDIFKEKLNEKFGDDESLKEIAMPFIKEIIQQSSRIKEYEEYIFNTIDEYKDKDGKKRYENTIEFSRYVTSLIQIDHDKKIQYYKDNKIKTRTTPTGFEQMIALSKKIEKKFVDEKKKAEIRAENERKAEERRLSVAAKREAESKEKETGFRTWTTADGKQQISAKFIGYTEDGKARLEREDGRSGAIAVKLLSQADQEYLTKKNSYK